MEISNNLLIINTLLYNAMVCLSKVNSFAQSELSNKQICLLFLICIKRSKLCTVFKNFAQTCLQLLESLLVQFANLYQFGGNENKKAF